MVSFSAPKIPVLAEARLVGALLVVAPPPKGRHKACPYKAHREPSFIVVALSQRAGTGACPYKTHRAPSFIRKPL